MTAVYLLTPDILQPGIAFAKDYLFALSTKRVCRKLICNALCLILLPISQSLIRRDEYHFGKPDRYVCTARKISNNISGISDCIAHAVAVNRCPYYEKQATEHIAAAEDDIMVASILAYNALKTIEALPVQACNLFILTVMELFINFAKTY